LNYLNSLCRRRLCGWVGGCEWVWTNKRAQRYLNKAAENALLATHVDTYAHVLTHAQHCQTHSHKLSTLTHSLTHPHDVLSLSLALAVLQRGAKEKIEQIGFRVGQALFERKSVAVSDRPLLLSSLCVCVCVCVVCVCVCVCVCVQLCWQELLFSLCVQLCWQELHFSLLSLASVLACASLLSSLCVPVLTSSLVVFSSSFRTCTYVVVR
jgi:hypothetical protein